MLCKKSQFYHCPTTKVTKDNLYFKKKTYSAYTPKLWIYLLSDNNFYYSFPLMPFLSFLQTGKAISENENTSNRAEECIAERTEVFKSAFGETEEQLNQEKYVT